MQCSLLVHRYMIRISCHNQLTCELHLNLILNAVRQLICRCVLFCFKRIHYNIRHTQHYYRLLWGRWHLFRGDNYRCCRGVKVTTLTDAISTPGTFLSYNFNGRSPTLPLLTTCHIGRCFLFVLVAERALLPAWQHDQIDVCISHVFCTNLSDIVQTVMFMAITLVKMFRY